MQQEKMYKVGDKVETDYKGKVVASVITAREVWPNNENQYKIKLREAPAGFIWRRPLDLRRVK